MIRAIRVLRGTSTEIEEVILWGASARAGVDIASVLPETSAARSTDRPARTLYRMEGNGRTRTSQG